MCIRDRCMSVLSLQQPNSLSVLTYPTPTMSLAMKQINELGVCWKIVINEDYSIITNGNLSKVIYMD